MVDTPTGYAIVCGSAYGLGTFDIEINDDPGAEEDLPAMAAG